MFFKLDQHLYERYQHVFSNSPYLTGNCKTWESGEGMYRFIDEETTLMTIDRNGNYRCYLVKKEENNEAI